MYKVWIEIEEIPEDNDLGQTIGIPDCLYTFETAEEAQKFVEVIKNFAEGF